MDNNNLKLSVIIPSMERINMTEKTIKSIREGCTVFKNENIIIYVYDNLSDLNDETRFIKFQKMLKDGLIQYYSYDTKESVANCFAKSYCFKRWIDDLSTRDYINSKFKKPVENLDDHYYMLCDNDMLFQKTWDEYFVSAAKSAPETTHFIVKYPGGCTAVSNRTGIKSNIKNIFNEEETINTQLDGIGGASGMWFMTKKMLKGVRWDNDDFVRTYNRHKRHDSGTWSIIKKRNARIPGMKYVYRVVPPDNKYLILHLGGVVGSLCNNLNNKNYTPEIKNKFRISDEEVGRLSIDELFSKYGESCKSW